MRPELSPETLHDLYRLPELLLPWFSENARSMPWRETPKPYYTWISEIMLQQTRVEAATGYFLRFIETLPDVSALAGADEEKLLKLWEGLGYYSRARNLKKAAEILCRDYNGTLPADHKALLSLPGIGSYTAGAIASIAFELPYPAVDGNVLRVVSRVSGCREDITDAAVKKGWEAIITGILPKREIGNFNQSLMELGALICLPNGAPRCMECPLSGICRGFREGNAEKLPVKAAKKARRAEKMTVFLLVTGKKVALRKRGDAGLLAGLWELPNCPGHLTEEELRAALARKGVVAEISPAGEAKHIFSHIECQMKGFVLALDGPLSDEALVWCTKKELEREFSLPSAFKKYRKLLESML